MAQAMTTDQRYEKSGLGKARAARYAETDKGLARRRRWADENRPALAQYAKLRRKMIRDFAKWKAERERQLETRVKAARARKKLKK